jgi:peptide methionine sulfoxide reductase MsrB
MVDQVYDAIDCCTNAQKIAFELKDTELEVRCEAFLGKIFYKGLKDNSRAKRHFMNTIRLE